jgi:septal ring factor EnvC (AmiA/AmiB activator)
MSRQRGIAVVAAGLLAGCAASQCDPQQADLFTGVGCEVGGGFAQRAQYQQSELANARAVALQQRGQAESAGQQATAAQADVAMRRRRLAVLDSQTQSLRRQLAAARQTHAADTAALRQAEGRIDALQRQLSAVSEAPSEAELADLENQRRTLADLLTRL